ncbi:MAG: cation:proton antiporter, partial [Chloroflexota bacterium]|nr:cation:proton antiporter [Chloroflexota bacterium]
VIQSLGLASLKAALFIVVALALGSWLLPRIMGRVAALGSRELRLVSVLILSLGVALGTAAAGLSPGLGAFAAGLILAESDYAFQALADVTPLRDTLTILFFVSVGMLIDPGYVRESLPTLAYVIPAVMVGKFFIAAAIVRNGGYPGRTATLVGLSLLPISEFSFVLAKVGLDKGVIDQSAYSLILTTAMVSILAAPLLFTGVTALHRRLGEAPVAPEMGKDHHWLSNHVVICGHGRIGRHLVEVLRQQHLPYLVIDLDPKVVSKMRAQGEPCLYGDASHPEVLAQAQLAAAKVLVLTYSDPVATEMVVKQAKKINPNLEVVARVYRDADAEHFRSLGVTELVRLELEEAKDVINFTLHKLGMSGLEIRDILDKLRTRT